MDMLLISVFLCGYLFILIEHSVGVDKAAIAVCMMLAMVGIAGAQAKYAVMNGEDIASFLAFEGMFESAMFNAAGISFFLLSSMCIVEIMDSFGCFDLVASKLSMLSGNKFIISGAFFAFFMSALLDNMTSCIVMSVLIKKMIPQQHIRWMILSLILLSVNIGGAWSPIGDITTTMLWIKGAVTTKGLVMNTIAPCLVAEIVAIMGVILLMKAHGGAVSFDAIGATKPVKDPNATIVGCVGLGSLLSAPVLHSVLRIPPFIAITGGLGILWLVVDILKLKPIHHNEPGIIYYVMSKINLSAILFFYGIIISISVLEYAGVLHEIAEMVISMLSSIVSVNFIIGVISSVLDNVPLVAAVSAMFDLTTYEPDSFLWYGLAYCAGVGGNIMLLGSAAGVALMGIDNMSIGWYLRNISLIAFASYVSGLGVMVLFAN